MRLMTSKVVRILRQVDAKDLQFVCQREILIFLKMSEVSHFDDSQYLVSF